MVIAMINVSEKNISVCERIKYIRETYDLTQQDIANILNLSNRSTVCLYEKERIIPIEHLSELADYLNLSMDYILGLTSDKYYKNSKKGISLCQMGKNINKICEEQHFTNVALAKILNSCESNIRNYRKGKYFLLTAFAIEIALKYGYSIDWLYGKCAQKNLNKKQEFLRAKTNV